MKYRTDIQGLRAVCVTIVILYHAKVPGFTGGFIGVDAFFVLSGFLITSLILKELRATKSLDVIAFWVRRIRRLLPNAQLVLLFTYLAALAVGNNRLGLTLPSDLAAASLYLANYHFAYRATDYFNHDAAMSAVLHYWSLSIEEQYYLVFPTVIWLGRRFYSGQPSTRCGVMLIVVTTISFGICLYWISRSQPDAFFRTKSQIWQIAVGGTVAVFFNRQLRRLCGRVLHGLV